MNSVSYEDFIISLAEAVGANIKLDIAKYKQFIEPYIKQYTVYRYWSTISIQLEIQPYYNTSKSLKAIAEMLKEEDLPSGPITKHIGKGFDVMRVLEEGLKTLTKERNFVKRVIAQNAHQQEVFFLDKVHVTKDNIVARYDANSGKIVIKASIVVVGKDKMKDIIKQISKLSPLLAIDAAYTLNIKVEATPNLVKREMLNAIQDILDIPLAPQKITIKKTGNKEVYTFAGEDAIFRITGVNGNWTFTVSIPHIGNKGLDEISIRETACFHKTGKSKLLDQIMSFFKKSLGEASSFLKRRGFTFDNRGNIVPM